MKIGIIKIIATLLLSVFILSNCTLQERRYRKGFYVNVKHKTHNKIEKHKKDDALAVIELKVKAKEEAGCKQELVASIVKTTPPIPKTGTVKSHKTKNDSCGDFIVMKDGTVVEGKITEISETEVKYKKCNNLSGPSYTTKLDKVARIKYSDGNEESFGTRSKNPVVSSVPSKSSTNDSWNPFAIASLIMGILSFTILLALVTGPLAFIFGIIAHNQINNESGNKGRGMATFGIVIGAIVLFVLLLLIIAMVTI